MRSLLTLATAFIALAGYLEVVSQPAQATQQAISNPVIRSQSPLIAHNAVKEAPAPRKVAANTESKPLNLQLPSFGELKVQFTEGKEQALNFLKKDEKPRISYNAELLFDEEKGEDIVGGQVHINIPFG